jgi:hypothetical protein
MIAIKKYNISFPVAELGNCNSLSECKLYCNDPVNQDTCISFAKQKGFYKQQSSAIENSLMLVAKNELGCDSKDSCKILCGQQDNWQKCGDFAKKYHLGNNHNNATDASILQEAKQILGCESKDLCLGFCQLESNRQKCDEFVKVVGLKGGEEKIGPGGCTSAQSCNDYCSNPANFQTCTSFASSQGQDFKGPGGCNSFESCISYCQSHLNECMGFLKDRSLMQGSIIPLIASSGAVVDTNLRKTKFEKVCQTNPHQCEQIKQNNPALYDCYMQGKVWDGKNCTEQLSTVLISRQTQEVKCKSGGGSCEWSGDYCKCNGYKGAYPNGGPDSKRTIGADPF